MSLVFHDKAWKEVSRVLSSIPNIRAAAGWRADGSLAALDACLPAGVWATSLRGTDSLAITRPYAVPGALMPGLRQAPGEKSVLGERDTRKEYQHATRVAAFGSSASGSHPAWDPV
jgi:hypothetical protein